MSSWQAKVFNGILSLIAKSGLHAHGSSISLAEIRQRLLALDSRYFAWPLDLHSNHYPLSHSALYHYRISPEPAPLALFYVRGGGFCFQTPHAHGRFIAELCRELGAEAFVPDYRLAPEYPFPAPFDDVMEALQALLERWHGPYVVIGDSAGGNLAMASLLQIKRRGLRPPCCAVLISPALDLAITGDSERLFAVDDPFFTPESLLRLRGAYLQGTNPMDPRVSPLQGDVLGLPPCLLLAGKRELLLEDAERMAAKLARAGVAVESNFVAHMPHVFPLFELLPEAQHARELIVDFIQRHAAP